MKDSHGREINYMRISITDRCNLRCVYCMPHGITCVPMEEILTYEEIVRICAQAVTLGITRFRVTGGEPLVRLGCSELIRMIKQISGVEQVSMTTNGVLLKNYLPELTDSGLDSVNISLDTLDSEKYKSITGFNEFSRVMASIDAALDAGMRVKLNCVLQQGLNADEWEDLLLLARNHPLDIRFIEMMPIGYGKFGKPVSNKDLFEKIKENYPDMEADSAVHGSGPAVYYKIPGFSGSAGFISPVHQNFCSECNRIRLTSTGDIKSCLCFDTPFNVRGALRKKTLTTEKRAPDQQTAKGRTCSASAQSSVSDDMIREILQRAITAKPAMHRFEEVSQITEQKEMAKIGG
ncbi:MAG: GTP 3',8-cyclase MoaA [Clostridiales bacterium]|nr:GTP 3',8-cyclase MoaA [Clostridiales bacterium]